MGLKTPTDVRTLYGRLRSTSFPELGKRVGDFALYDSLLAGCADRAARGEVVPSTEVPVPDEETLRRVDGLKAKIQLDDGEAAFLRYFELLEQIRASLISPGTRRADR